MKDVFQWDDGYHVSFKNMKMKELNKVLQNGKVSKEINTNSLLMQKQQQNSKKARGESLKER